MGTDAEARKVRSKLKRNVELTGSIRGLLKVKCGQGVRRGQPTKVSRSWVGGVRSGIELGVCGRYRLPSVGDVGGSEGGGVSSNFVGSKTERCTIILAGDIT